MTGLIRWNANFMRGLAESVLERAQAIRGSLLASENKKAKTKPRKVKAKRKRNG